ncbi:MAG: polysaccharide ABC transporter ATP-binding protein [bacterium]
MKGGSGVLALSCVGLTKTFPVMDGASVWRILLGSRPDKSIVAVDQVSLPVPKGTIVGVLGRNGAGKSTLLRLLGGVYTPSAGQIWREGSMAGLFELGGIGHRFLTGREYARRAMAVQGARSREIGDCEEEIHDFTELGDAFEEPIYTYSTGMAARLYFASATALAHDVYLIDELLAVGDEHFQAKCWKRVRERLTSGASGVLVTHDWSAVLRLCEVSHIMERGCIVESGLTDKVVRTYLGLERPSARIARFSGSNPTQYTAESEQPTQLRFVVDLLEPVPVVFAYSVEMLRLGVGWEILLLADNLPVADAPDRYEVRLNIPRLPLPGGHYYLNVFLTSPRLPGKSGPVEAYDVRSWTYGNALDLLVTGAPSRAATVLPLEWEPVVLDPMVG